MKLKTSTTSSPHAVVQASSRPRAPKRTPSDVKAPSLVASEKVGVGKAPRPRVKDSPQELVQAVLRDLSIVQGEGQYWVDANTHWARLQRKVLTVFQERMRAFDVIHEEPGKLPRKVDISSRNLIGNLAAYIDCAPELDIPGFFDAAMPGVSLLTGFLKLNDDGTTGLLPHDREQRCRHHVPIVFDPAAQAPYTCEVLASHFDHLPDGAGKKKALIEFLALCLFGQAASNRRGTIVALVGPPGTGKSTLAENLVAASFSSDMIGSVDPHSLNNPNERLKLVARRINVADEIESRPLKDVGTIKKILSGAQTSVKSLYRDAATARITCGHLLIGNELPKFADRSGALHDRVLPIEFNERYRGPFVHPTIIARRMMEPQERSGLLNILLAAYRDMIERGGGTPRLFIPESAKNYQKTAAREADPVRRFIDECCTNDPSKRVRATYVLDAFKRWCKVEGIPIPDITAADIGRRLTEIMPDARRPKPDGYDSHSLWMLRVEGANGD